MNIGLDYDDTYTRDPAAWDAFCTLMRHRGHFIYLVTWRDELECEEIRCMGLRVDGIYPTNRKAKEKFMYNEGIRIDVWIDDNPSAIIQDMQKY